MYILGFDIGGTKIEGNLIYFGDKSKKNHVLNFQYQDKKKSLKPAQLLSKKRIPTERHNGYPQVIKKLGELTNELCEESEISLKNLKGIGLSIPGPIHPNTGEIIMSNSMIMAGHRLHNDFKKALKLKIPVLAENDANCFALAEVYCGAGLAYFQETKIPVYEQTAIGVILGSGCGGGIVKDGSLLRGKRGGGGEIGHTILYPNGHPCYCGRAGCAEQYVSGPGLEAAANARSYAQIQGKLDSEKIFELYNLKDPIALAVVKQYKKDLALFFGSLSCVIDPHYFVLGGGLSIADQIYVDLEPEVTRNNFIQSEPPQILKHKIGDSAGAIGAALIVKDFFEKIPN